MIPFDVQNFLSNLNIFFQAKKYRESHRSAKARQSKSVVVWARRFAKMHWILQCMIMWINLDLPRDVRMTNLG